MMKYVVLFGFVAVAAAQFFGGPRQFNGGGGGPAIDANLGGSVYHFSWRHDGNREYVQSAAVGYCSQLGSGWAPVSIESPDENNFVSGVIGSNRLNWIWTGGAKAGNGWRWPSGGSFNGLNWSHTGGSQRPQPDNREGNENCLAILNSFYNDGIKWHDVACHHEKPTICERRA